MLADSSIRELKRLVSLKCDFTVVKVSQESVDMFEYVSHLYEI
jgi:hypothetical protein